MLKLKSSLLSPKLPEEWKPMYYIKFFDKNDSDLLIDHQTYLSVLPALNSVKFVVIHGQTFNVAGIDKIVYRYEPENIPPCPKPEYENTLPEGSNTYIQTVKNQDRIDLWNELFAGDTEELEVYGTQKE